MSVGPPPFQSSFIIPLKSPPSPSCFPKSTWPSYSSHRSLKLSNFFDVGSQPWHNVPLVARFALLVHPSSSLTELKERHELAACHGLDHHASQ